MARSNKEYLLLTFSFEKEDDQWTACCEELGTATFADTLDQARTELEELVDLHLNALEEVGERERFFKEHGIKPHKIGEKHLTLSIPVEQKLGRQARFYKPYTFSLTNA
jgi:predicted RNase H-like HicB family nuclease